MKFVATKWYDNKFCFTPLFCSCFWIRDPGWVKIRIRDKHPGSATLLYSYLVHACSYLNEFLGADPALVGLLPRVAAGVLLHVVFARKAPVARIGNKKPTQKKPKNHLKNQLKMFVFWGFLGFLNFKF